MKLHHFKCEECGQYIAFEYESKEELQRLLTDYELVQAKFLCEDCFNRMEEFYDDEGDNV